MERARGEVRRRQNAEALGVQGPDKDKVGLEGWGGGGGARG